MKAKEERTKGAVVTDPEAVALHRIIKALQPLSARGRRRLLAYVADLLQEQTETPWTEPETLRAD